MKAPDPRDFGRWRRLVAGAAGALVLAALIAGIALSSGGGWRSTDGTVATGPAGTGAGGTGAAGTGPAQTRAAETAPATAPALPAGTPTETTPTPRAPPGPPGKPPSAAEQFGVNVNRLFNDRTYSPQQIDAQLRAVRATGSTIARSDALWEATEPTAPVGGVHRYDWDFDDAIAAALARHGLKWLPIIDYSAPWAQSVPGVDHSPPSSAAQYAAYAEAVAARYGAGGSFWREHPTLQALPVDTYEIWNEPDDPNFWSPRVDPARYADLYMSARAAIDAADPSARVIIGGVSNLGGFLASMLASRPALLGHVDGVGIHPYAPSPDGVLSVLVSARRTMTAIGLGPVPIYVTEFGWPTRPPGGLDRVPEHRRPGDIRRTVTVLGHLNCGIATAILYTWVTPERNPRNREDWFGIHSRSGSGTPDSAAFAAGLRAAAAPGPELGACAG
jgi:polysaccharide biosynthesis protein PslG